MKSLAKPAASAAAAGDGDGEEGGPLGRRCLMYELQGPREKKMAG